MTTTTPAAPTTVGEFTYNPADSTIVGPAEYIRSPEYRARMASITAGTDVVFNQGAAGLSPTPEVALLVSVQTDYAAWRGARSLA